MSAEQRDQIDIEAHNVEEWRRVIYDAFGDAVKTERAIQLAQLNGLFDWCRGIDVICAACGLPWTGEPCGQKDNEHPFPVCYPIHNSKGVA